ncbi:hypothetical protein P175DRAFT_0501091 [Aspergillus ochraceoroseus IBT 24754]|uniref:Ubiquitin 3 binding protein But2 C-terminal domain-containing protein n=2 Tax=Aspergillus ochraceoroseus TaxID=138278 RepID=A0A2T5LW00_9EURO|nr:uncharacterized protein P175DRAFT_0501091 [Aspergillus ochraceoroseus IBT 24754]KKK22196.1 hypothetical protein AOCH_001504 [Aspergillus ochraceoroseus]PTU20458.1 hypothetical protein P175DRAFT_0501091 [Aspergillus ochraceoroseus IBT 24754]
MFKSLGILVSLLLSTTIAAPSLTSSARRSCSTAFPWTIDTLSAATPDTPSIGHEFTLARSGNPLNNTVISAITFFIPDNAYGCNLNIQIPILAANQIASGASSALFWSTAPWDNYNNLPTWNNPPAITTNVGSFNFPTVAVTSPYTTTISSSSCANTLSYLVELSSWQGAAGSVDFNAQNGLGFTVIYNC